MNHHEFVHEMAMIHAAMKRVLCKLPEGKYKKERQELLSVKRQIFVMLVILIVIVSLMAMKILGVPAVAQLLKHFTG